MAEEKPPRKIVSETFVDEKGNVVDSAAKAVQIEVVEELPDGRHLSHIIVKHK